MASGEGQERHARPPDPSEQPDQPKVDRPRFGEARNQQKRVPEIQADRLAQAIGEIQKGYDPSVRFETLLMLEGLLSRLEQAGIVPTVENPNPYDPELDEDQHERWWEEHLPEAEKFDRAVDRRNEVLRYLYIGATIGSGPWRLP
jgi:hypothetical protein